MSGFEIPNFENIGVSDNFLFVWKQSEMGGFIDTTLTPNLACNQRVKVTVWFEVGSLNK